MYELYSLCHHKCLRSHSSGGKQVLLANSTDNLILDLLSGRTDAALLRSDAIPNLQRRGVVNASAFKFIDAVPFMPLFAWLASAMQRTIWYLAVA